MLTGTRATTAGDLHRLHTAVARALLGGGPGLRPRGYRKRGVTLVGEDARRQRQVAMSDAQGPRQQAEALDREARLQAAAFLTPEHAEGRDAFFARRKPKFR